MNFRVPASGIQEEVLFPPRVTHGRDPVRERHIRPIAAEMDWSKQRVMWQRQKAKSR